MTCILSSACQAITFTKMVANQIAEIIEIIWISSTQCNVDGGDSSDRDTIILINDVNDKLEVISNVFWNWIAFRLSDFQYDIFFSIEINNNIFLYMFVYCIGIYPHISARTFFISLNVFSLWQYILPSFRVLSI